MAEKVTRVLHSQGLNRDKYDRLARIAILCGKVRADAWQRYSGVSTASQSPYEIRDAWMAEGCDWHGLPARLGKAIARNLQAYTGHPEPARTLNALPRPARSAGEERDVETRRSHCREARARSVKRLSDRQPSWFDYPGP